jgi:hypothetical protein|tara:strand:- start:1096 stop:1398 length:303 start_codon:yes stop_codon:yes gene_type:complete
MSILEYSGGKIFTSTGASPWQDAWSAEHHAFIAETNAGSSARLVVQSRMKGGTNTKELSTLSLAPETVGEVTFHRAAYQVRARVTNMTSTGTVTVRWFGN